MEQSLFDGAKFGDVYQTRNDKIAIYQELRNLYHRLITEEGAILVSNDGSCVYHTGKVCFDYDIVRKISDAPNDKPHGCDGNPDGCISSICPQTCEKFVVDEVPLSKKDNKEIAIDSEGPIDKKTIDELAEDLSERFWSDDMEAFDGNSLEREIYYVCKRCYASGIKDGYRIAMEEINKMIKKYGKQ